MNILETNINKLTTFWVVFFYTITPYNKKNESSKELLFFLVLH